VRLAPAQPADLAGGAPGATVALGWRAMTLKHHEFEKRIDEAVAGVRERDDVLDPELKREVLSAASRGPEALEGLLACLSPGERSAAFGFLQSEEGNAATARTLNRVSPEEANFHARRAAIDAAPVPEPRAVAAEVTRRAVEETRTAEPAVVEEAAPAPEVVNEEAVNDHVDNVAAREAHFAKKWEGNDLLAQALARVKRKQG
jgi:hypothetical protein